MNSATDKNFHISIYFKADSAATPMTKGKLQCHDPNMSTPYILAYNIMTQVEKGLSLCHKLLPSLPHSSQYSMEVFMM